MRWKLSEMREMRCMGLLVLALIVSGCSLSPPDESPRVAYREAESTKSLVLPPDLTRQPSVEAFEIEDPRAADGGDVLPEFRDIRMVRAGPIQWIEVDGVTPKELWPRMSGFFRNEGLVIASQQPSAGIIETAWAERFDSVPRGGLGGFFSNLLGSVTSDPIRDKYQIRLEPTDDNTGARVFLTHWAAQEINQSPSNRQTPVIATARVEPDPAIAAEMRRRLLVYMGVSRQRATRVASLDDDASVYTAPMRLVQAEDGEAQALLAEPDFRRAMGLVSEGLGLAGAQVVESSARDARIWVRWLPPEHVRGSGLFSDDRPQSLFVKLEPVSGGVRILAGEYRGQIGNEERYEEDFGSGKTEVALLEALVNAMGGDISTYRNIEDPEDYLPGTPTEPDFRR